MFVAVLADWRLRGAIALETLDIEGLSATLSEAVWEVVLWDLTLESDRSLGGITAWGRGYGESKGLVLVLCMLDKMQRQDSLGIR